MSRLPVRISNSRHVFKVFKRKITHQNNQQSVQEFERALEALIKTYNTTIHTNRFIVGNATELLLCALARALGFVCHVSDQERTDLYIQIPGGKGGQFSVKSNFTGKGDIRLINVMGSSADVRWEEPTIFLIATRGIYYADPYMGIHTRRTGDAIVVKIDELEQRIKPAFKIIHVKIPLKPAQPAHIKSPAYDIVKAILQNIGSQILKGYI